MNVNGPTLPTAPQGDAVEWVGCVHGADHLASAGSVPTEAATHPHTRHPELPEVDR